MTTLHVLMIDGRCGEDENLWRLGMSNRFVELLKFLEEDMRMSHIYQPLIIMGLLQREGGVASKTEIARLLASEDESQIAYYRKVISKYPKQTLEKHGIATVNKSGCTLIGFNDLNKDEICKLRDLCQAKIAQFLKDRKKIWNHRKQSSGYISGTVRWRVLERAKTRCEACGISHKKKALEVDHIVPRNCGGSDDESNLQALCYSCNAMKRDRSDTDFRLILQSYKERVEGCGFCDGIQNHSVLFKNELAYVVKKIDPITNGHCLIIPKRHVSSLFELYQPELNAINQLIFKQQEQIKTKDLSVTGFNVSNDIGKDAGQKIMHCHTHLIPRRKGDSTQLGVRHHG